MAQFPLTNKIDSDSVRRACIGLGLGLIIVFIGATFISPKNEIHSTLDFDTETIAVVHEDDEVIAVEGDRESVSPVNLHNSDNTTANLYPYFSKNKSSLSNVQYDAISNNTPHLSVILNQVGQSRSVTESISKSMPNAVTIAMSPYATTYDDTAKSFHDKGHEIWQDIAAITLTKNADRGENALNPTTNFENNIIRLSRQIGKRDYIAGLILPAQSLVVNTPTLWTEISADIFSQGYGILDNTAQIAKPSLYIHNEKRSPYLKGDMAIDKNLNLNEFKQALNNIQKQTIRQKSMIVTISASTPAKLDILSQWLDNLKQNQITLVPLSGQVKF